MPDHAGVCTTVTEELYKMHKHSINDAVHDVLKKLDRNDEENIIEQIEGLSITQTQVIYGIQTPTVWDNVPTGPRPVQEMAGCITNQRDKSRIEVLASERPTNLYHDDQACSSTDYGMKASSVHPIQPSPSSLSHKRSSRAAKNSPTAFKEHLSSQYQRQMSSPDTFASRPPSPSGVKMHHSNVTWFQSGHNNTMYIFPTGPSERKRHSTAPPTCDFPLH